jgi:hypothetical protein
MKKIFIGILIILLGFLGFIFFKPTVKNNIQIITNCPESSLARNINTVSLWDKWWPGKKINNSTFNFNGAKYTLQRQILNGMAVQVEMGNQKINGYLQFNRLTDTSSFLLWASLDTTSLNFLQKIKTTFLTNPFKKNIKQLLDSMNLFFSNQKNIYGFAPIFTKVKDPNLISIKKQFLQYPTTTEIYKEINILLDYAKTNGATQTNPPMMHVRQSEDIKFYDVMIAIPIDKVLSGTSTIVPKLMIKGNLLEATIAGSGTVTIEKCLQEYQNFITDYHLSAPAIPYQSLITNRLTEPDTTKWVTKIYQPIF